MRDIEALTGRVIKKIRIVGGGSQNALLAQATADRTKRLVETGPVEATAAGNILAQSFAGTAASGEEIRAIVSRSFPSRKYGTSTGER
mgnify:CR=1 FL=1